MLPSIQTVSWDKKAYNVVIPVIKRKLYFVIFNTEIFLLHVLTLKYGTKTFYPLMILQGKIKNYLDI